MSLHDLQQAFKDEMLERWNPPALQQQVLASQQRRRLVDRALRMGQHTPWDFQPHQDATQQYMRNHLDLNDLERRTRFPSPEIPAPDSAVL